MSTINQKLVCLLIAIMLIASFGYAEIIVSDANQLAISADYSRLRDSDSRLSFSGNSITLTNNGNASEVLSLSIIDLASGFRDLTLDATNFTLAPSATQTVRLSGEIPVDLDQGNHTSIAKLKVNTASGQQATFPFNVNIRGMLELNRINVYVNGVKEESIDSDGDTISSPKPGDQVELRFLLENRYDNDYNDGTINGKIRMRLDDSNFGDEIDEEVNFELPQGDRFGENDAPSINFTIPSSADEDDYTFEIEIKGKDDNRAEYQINWENTKLSIKRERNDVRVSQLTLTPAEISCSRRVQISTKVMNYGTDEQRHAALTVFNPTLDISQNFNFSLNSGTSSNNYQIKDFYVDIGNDVLPGRYPITARAYYDYTTLIDQDNVDLVIGNCVTVAPTVTNNTASQNTNAINNTSTTAANTVTTNNTTTTSSIKTSSSGVDAKIGQAADKDKISSSAIVQTQEEQYTKEDVVFAALIVGTILVLMLVILFIVILLKD